MSTPQDWGSALIAAGFTDRRSKEPSPSWRALAESIGVHASTLTAMRDGTRDTDQATVDAVAQALRMDVLVVSEWVGRARTERAPYRAPDEANLLDQDERAAVDKLIHLLARSKRGGTSDGRTPEAQKSPGGGEPASGGGSTPPRPGSGGAGGAVVSRPKFGAGSKRGDMLDNALPVERAADERGDSASSPNGPELGA